MENAVAALNLPRKILVHLLPYRPEHDDYVLPKELTQEGIAIAVEVRRSQVSLALKGLVEKGLVEERKTHISSQPRRMKAYMLTHSGRALARDIFSELKDVRIIVSVAGVERETVMQNVLEEHGIPATSIVNQLEKIGKVVIPEKSASEQDEKTHIYFSEPQPAPTKILGREKERRELLEWLARKDGGCIVLGMAGIGKSLLVRSVVDEVHKEINVFWLQVETWSTPRSVIRKLGEYLDAMRMPMVSNMSERNDVDLDLAVDSIVKAGEREKQVLVIDDMQKLRDQEVCAALLKCSRRPGTQVILISRDSPRCYDRRDVSLCKTIKEMELGELSREDSMRMLSEKGFSIDMMNKIYDSTGGHPLAIELCSISPNAGMEDVHRFFKEQVLSILSHGERSMLSLSAVFRRPFSMDSIFDRGEDYETLDLLLDKNLIFEVKGGYTMHNVLSETLISRMNYKERITYHALAADYYAHEVDPSSGLAEDVLEASYHYVEAGLLSDAASLLVEHCDIFLRQGFQHDALDAISSFEGEEIEGDLEYGLEILRANLLLFTGRVEEAAKILASVLSRMDGNSPTHSNALNSMGTVLYKKGRLDEAMEAYTDALVSAERSGNREQMARAIGHMAVVHGDRGNLDLAIIAHQMDMGISETRGDKMGMARATNNMGIIHHMQNDYKSALIMFTNALRLASEAGDRHTATIARNNIGDTYRCMGQFPEAMKHFMLGLDEARGMRYPWEEAEALFYLGQLEKGEKGRKMLQNALEMYKCLGCVEKVREIELLIEI
ncbi:MAG: tetratricopeptide repeat protein [Candidatus Thermoplasmatota archaeon]|nr:tetratricopeptide repeat protein [Candidatus Thermoplasmatota archaeon]